MENYNSQTFKYGSGISEIGRGGWNGRHTGKTDWTGNNHIKPSTKSYVKPQIKVENHI